MGATRHKLLISPLDVEKAKTVLDKTRPPVTKDEAVELYIDLWDMYAEMYVKYEKAAKKLKKLMDQNKYWKDKANKAQPRITPIKYE